MDGHRLRSQLHRQLSRVDLLAGSSDAQFCARLAAGLTGRGRDVVVARGHHRRDALVHAASIAAALDHGTHVDVLSCRGSELELLALEPATTQEQIPSLLRSAGAIHASSDAVARQARELVQDVPVRVIAPGAHTAERLDPGDGPLRIVCHAPLTWISGFDYLLAALARLRARELAFTATVFGSGPLLAALRFGCDDLDLRDRVTVIGHENLDELRASLRACDVFVSASHHASIVETAVEAMALGIPVIATRAGGMPELVRDGVDGLLVAPRDIAGLADAIASLDRRRSLQLGRAAREHAGAAFSAEAELAAFAELYDLVTRGQAR